MESRAEGQKFQKYLSLAFIIARIGISCGKGNASSHQQGLVAKEWMLQSVDF